jgi:hypothetical protein
MCVYSMVFDHYDKLIPYPTSQRQDFDNDRLWIPAISQLDLEKIIKEFGEAAEAAKVVDRLTDQPDCEDPDKAKLLKRIDELEARISEIEVSKKKKKAKRKKKAK